MRATLTVLALLTLVACDTKNAVSPPREDSPKGHGVQVLLSVRGLDVGGAASAPGPRKSVSAPAGDEYFGMGQHVGQAVVDGFRIRLTGVELRAEGSNGVRIVDWAEPQELEVARGFEGAITGTGTLEPGTYSFVNVQLQSNYDIKAWAYLDRNNDGAIDRTMWTTAAGVQTADAVLAPAALTDYDYFHYGFLYPGKPGDNDSREDSPLPAALTIATDATSQTVTVDLRLDTFQIAQAWDGDAGTRAGVFAWDDGTALPEGAANFAVGYLPLFALVNDPAGVGETYAFSGSNTFPYDDLQLATLLFAGDGSPIFGRVRNAGSNSSLGINQFLGAFTEETDGSLSFYADGDGHLYAGDVSSATHHITGFQRLAVTDFPVPVSVAAGPACTNYCDQVKAGFAKRLAR